jgi:hypothetical protein
MPLWQLHVLALLYGCRLLFIVPGRGAFNARLLVLT